MRSAYKWTAALCTGFRDTGGLLGTRYSVREFYPWNLRFWGPRVCGFAIACRAGFVGVQTGSQVRGSPIPPGSVSPSTPTDSGMRVFKRSEHTEHIKPDTSNTFQTQEKALRHQDTFKKQLHHTASPRTEPAGRYLDPRCSLIRTPALLLIGPPRACLLRCQPASELYRSASCARLSTPRHCPGSISSLPRSAEWDWLDIPR